MFWGVTHKIRFFNIPKGEPQISFTVLLADILVKQDVTTKVIWFGKKITVF
jgi:hypothetical protein